jgi:hypothetical protein
MFVGGSMADINAPSLTEALTDIPAQTDWQSADNSVSMDLSSMLLCYSCTSHDLIASIYPWKIRCGHVLFSEPVFANHNLQRECSHSRLVKDLAVIQEVSAFLPIFS